MKRLLKAPVILLVVGVVLVVIGAVRLVAATGQHFTTVPYDQLAAREWEDRLVEVTDAVVDEKGRAEHKRWFFRGDIYFPISRHAGDFERAERIDVVLRVRSRRDEAEALTTIRGLRRAEGAVVTRELIEFFAERVGGLHFDTVVIDFDPGGTGPRRRAGLFISAGLVIVLTAAVLFWRGHKRVLR